MTKAVTVHQEVPHADQALTVEQIKGRVQLIQRVMSGIMKKDVHYGVIPGTDKPSLYKPGSEALLTAFRISVEPEVEDLSTADEFRYRVRAVGKHQGTGIVIGIGVGEASTNEGKYMWRSVVCAEEWEATPEDRKRELWKRGRNSTVYSVQQVRTNPADQANTVLKMAKKRAQIDMTLTALGASDIFSQDLEDMDHPPIEEPTSTSAKAGTTEPRAVEQPTDSDRQAPAQGQPPAERPRTGNGGGTKIATVAQARLLHTRLDQSGVPENAYLKHFGVDSVEATPFNRVDEALQWIKDSAG